LRILTFAFHGAYEFELSKTGNRFFRLPVKGIESRDFGSRPVPENYQFLEKIPNLEEFDLLLCDSPKRYLETVKWDIPKAVACHTHLTGKDKSILRKIPDFVPKVFISHSNFQQSGISRGFIIYHSIDTEIYSDYNGEKPELLMTGNHIANRGECNYKIFKQIAGAIPFQIMGNNPELPVQLSFEAPEYKTLKQTYRDYRVYLNTVEAPVTMGMLEAMATGMPVLSLAYGDMPLIIQNGRNGYCSSDPGELREVLLGLMNNPERAKKLGEEGRKTIKRLFSPQVFGQRWNHIFDLAVANYNWYKRRGNE